MKPLQIAAQNLGNNIFLVISSYGNWIDPHQFIIFVGHTPSEADLKNGKFEILAKLGDQYRQANANERAAIIDNMQFFWTSFNNFGGSASW